MTILSNAFGNNDNPKDGTLVESPNRFKGKIMKLHRDNGWGFINSHEIKFTRIFFHWSGLKPTTLNFTALQEGMEVEFNTVDVPEKGKRATKIVVTNTEVPAKQE